MMPGEYRPQPIMTPGSLMAKLARGGQQPVKSRAWKSELHVCACQTVVHVSHSAMA
jgi:hypothetical protein